MRGKTVKLTLLLAGTCAAALAAAGASTGARHRATAGKTLVFGAAADPVVLDGALVSDGESLRVIGQIFEGLVGLKPGTTNVVPLLATRWKHDKSGKLWTFTLRNGVKFQDGTRFSAAAVCYNFRRWYNFRGLFQRPTVTLYWQLIFRGFRQNEDPDLSASLFKSCTAKGRYTVTIKLVKRFAPFLSALTLPAFSIASPTALRRYGADQAEVRNGVFQLTGTYGFKHPTGTGPFRFKSWTLGRSLEIDRNPAYWGKKAKLAKVVFRPIGSSSARLQALQTGAVMGYDAVAAQSYGTIKKNPRLKLLRRLAFNLGYVTIHQGPDSPMNELKVRQAVAYGLDRAHVVKAVYPPGSAVAKEFMPPALPGYATKGVKSYSYDPGKAKRLLNSSSCHVPCRVHFWYPSSASQPYMPDPRRSFDSLSASLEQAGFEVIAHTAPWRDYAKRVDAGEAGDLNLEGTIGDYGDPDDFVGVFQAYSDQFGFRNARISNLLNEAESELNVAKRIKLYQQANRLIMDYLPGVPYVRVGSALGLEKVVKGYIPSPISLDPFSIVSVG